MQATAQVFSNLRGHMQIYSVFFVHDSDSSTIGDNDRFVYLVALRVVRYIWWRAWKPLWVSKDPMLGVPAAVPSTFQLPACRVD